MERNYEIMLVIIPEVSSEERKAIAEKIMDSIKRLEGKITLSTLWAEKRNFCYPIRSRGAQKKKYQEGAYWLINFVLEPKKLPDLKEVIRLEERILRYIMVSKG